MAENDLSNDPNINSLLASLNAVYASLRSTFAPRSAAGVVSPGAADLGSSTNPWDNLYVNTLIAGGRAVDLPSLALSSAIYVFDAADADFLWPGTQTKCLAFAFSGVAGGQGTTGLGTAGGATTVTRGGENLTSRAQPESTGGSGGRFESEYSGWGNTAAAGSATLDLGLQRARTRIFTGLSKGNSFNIQIGAGGAGGAGGGANGNDGFAILFAFG